MKVKLLDQTHPAYDAEELRRYRALFEGKHRWRELVKWWLPKHPEEADEVYAARLHRALYENHAGPIVSMLAAATFAEAPTVELDGATSWLESFEADVDGRGSALAPWFTERLSDALVERRVFVWVNLPQRPDGVETMSLGEEEVEGFLEAYLVGLTAEQVIDWREDSRGRLQWVMVRDTIEDRVAIEAERTVVHRWTYIDATVIRRWVWSPSLDGPTEPAPEDDATELPPIEHGFGTLPVLRLELSEALHAMGHIHDPAVAHLRSRNDLSWALHRAAHALLVIKARHQDERPILGPGYYLKLGQDDDAHYVEPSGSNFELLREDTKDLREELYRTVHQMAVGADSDAARSKLSGVSKAEDWHAMEIVIGALSAAMRDFMGETLRVVASARGMTKAQPSIGGLDGWHQEDLGVWLASAAMAVDAHQMSATFRRAVAKRQAQRLLADEDPKVLAEIEREIEAAEVDPAPYALPPAPGAPAQEDV